MLVPALVVAWILLVVAGVTGSIYIHDRSQRAQKQRAYREILAEKGVVQLPGETVKHALLRAKREESMKPGPFAGAIAESRKLSGLQVKTVPQFRPQAVQMPAVREKMPSRPGRG